VATSLTARLAELRDAPAIFPENLASRRLCAALGFREVGTYCRHAQLDGRWMDCVIVERLLGAAARG